MPGKRQLSLMKGCSINRTGLSDRDVPSICARVVELVGEGFSIQRIRDTLYAYDANDIYNEVYLGVALVWYFNKCGYKENLIEARARLGRFADEVGSGRLGGPVYISMDYIREYIEFIDAELLSLGEYDISIYYDEKGEKYVRILFD